MLLDFRRIWAIVSVLGSSPVSGIVSAQKIRENNSFFITTAHKTSQPQTKKNPFMPTYGETLPPFGYVDFCRREPEECKSSPHDHTKRFILTPERREQLEQVNWMVNRIVASATDLELYGKSEHWAIPANNKGDCEDYALLKRRLLMLYGWPSSALLMTVVRDEKGEGHAVLTARTNVGDYVLDNKNNDLKEWKDVPYTFLMRQGYLDPNIWVSLDPTDKPVRGTGRGR